MDAQRGGKNEEGRKGTGETYVTDPHPQTNRVWIKHTFDKLYPSRFLRINEYRISESETLSDTESDTSKNQQDLEKLNSTNRFLDQAACTALNLSRCQLTITDSSGSGKSLRSFVTATLLPTLGLLRNERHTNTLAPGLLRCNATAGDRSRRKS
jgi:hypothetical protein